MAYEHYYGNATEYGEFGFEEYDEGSNQYDGTYGEEEWPADQHSAQVPCANGPGCKFYAWGTCKYYHPEEDWSDTAATTTTTAGAGDWKPVTTSAAVSRHAQADRRWNVLVNRPTPSKSMQGDLPVIPDEFGQNSGDRERDTSRSPRRESRPPPVSAMWMVHGGSAGGSTVGPGLDEPVRTLEPPPGIF